MTIAQIWECLNQNASAVQALSAVASVVITLTLAMLTGRYVRLTRSLAETAQNDALLRARGSASKAAARRVRMTTALDRSLHMVEPLAAMDMDRADKTIRGLTTVDEDDLAAVVELGTEFDLYGRHRALAVIEALRRVIAGIDRVQGASDGAPAKILCNLEALQEEAQTAVRSLRILSDLLYQEFDRFFPGGVLDVH